MNTLYKSHFQDAENIHTLTQIESFYVEGSMPFEISLEQINIPSGVLHSMHIDYGNDDYLSITYSADYESKDIFLTLKDTSRTFVFKNEARILF